MNAYLSRLQQLSNPSVEMQTYIQRLSDYIQAGGASMEASDEVWLEFNARSQNAWDALPATEQSRARECAGNLT